MDNKVISWWYIVGRLAAHEAVCRLANPLVIALDFAKVIFKNLFYHSFYSCQHRDHSRKTSQVFVEPIFTQTIGYVSFDCGSVWTTFLILKRVSYRFSSTRVGLVFCDIWIYLDDGNSRRRPKPQTSRREKRGLEYARCNLDERKKTTGRYALSAVPMELFMNESLLF